MQVTYDGAHSLLIGDLTGDVYNPDGFINTWEDWHLIPTSRPVISPPTVQVDTIEVPGTNGTIDLTTALLGYPTYSNRTGSIDFYIDHNQWDWDRAYDNIMNSIHGFTKKVILTDTPSFYYEGRLSVNQLKSDKLASTITLDYDFNPFKQMIFTTTQDWLWNPFDFKDGLIIDPSDFTATVAGGSASTEKRYTVDITGLMPVVPTIKVDTVDWRVDWTKTGYQSSPPYVVLNQTWTNKGRTYTDAKTVVITADDETLPSGSSSSFLIHTDPTVTIGRPFSTYTLGVTFENYFKDSSGDTHPVKFSIDFRPGRL